MKIMMSDYEQNHYDKDLLKNSAVNLGTLEVPVTDLEQVRVLINKYCEEQPDSPKLSPEWCFIDCKYPFSHHELRNPTIATSLHTQLAQRSGSSGWTERRKISTLLPTLPPIASSCWIRSVPRYRRHRKTKVAATCRRKDLLSRGT